MNQAMSSTKKAQAKERGEDASTAAQYHSQLQLVPNIQVLMGKDAKLIKKPDTALITAASDYSYSASYYAGPHYRLVGDAAGERLLLLDIIQSLTFTLAFIDPYFSSGVHLAIAGGLSAAATICGIIRGDCTEADAIKWHTAKIDTAYTRCVTGARFTACVLTFLQDSCWSF